MNVTGCVPLAGQGLVARRGNLTAVTDGMDPGPDPLLAALGAVADAGGDAAALALAGTRAALERGGRPAWACAGVTFAGEVAVLVHGDAVALVSADGGPEDQVTASGSMIPVVRAFHGGVVTVRLAIGAPAAPDNRLWLDGGIVYGGGLLLTVTQEASQAFLPNESQPSAAATAPAELEPDAVPAPAAPVDVGYQPGYEPTMLAAPASRDLPPPPAAMAPEAGAAQPGEASDPGYEPTMLAAPAARDQRRPRQRRRVGQRELVPDRGSALRADRPDNDVGLHRRGRAVRAAHHRPFDDGADPARRGRAGRGGRHLVLADALQRA
jgi:hypothetical protein